MAKKEEFIIREGKVIGVPNASLYLVDLGNGHEVLCYRAGRMRRNNIRILVGDQVRVEMSPYDLTRGRIVYRQ